MMKKLTIAVLSIAVIFSCTNEKDNKKELKKEENKHKTEAQDKEQQPLSNIYGEDSIDAKGNVVYGSPEDSEFGVNKEVVPQVDSATGREYKLGPRPDIPLVNKYGDDSIGPNGNFVYPPVDTIWVEGES